MSQSVALATRNKQPVNIIVRYKLDVSIIYFLINNSLYLMPRICLNVFILSYEPYVQDTIQISLTLNSKKKKKD